MLVHHNRHLLVSPLHFLQQIRPVLGFRDEKCAGAPVRAPFDAALLLPASAASPAQRRRQMMSSSVSSYTGTRENFVSIRSLRSCSTVELAGMATTSGRGVMNSRTRLSLNSTTCSIICASSRSRMPSCSAASTRASIPSCCADSLSALTSSEMCASEIASLQNHAERPNDPQKRANDQRQTDQPAAFGPRQQKIGNKLREQEHFHQHVYQRLQQRVPRPGHKHDDAARGLGRNQNQP